MTFTLEESDAAAREFEARRAPDMVFSLAEAACDMTFSLEETGVPDMEFTLEEAEGAD